jgi:PAS domain S-box-containing protein
VRWSSSPDPRRSRTAAQRKAYRQEIAQTRERLIEAMEQQTATSEVLRIISNSPSEIQNEGKKAEERPRSSAQLQATLNVIPAYTWYAAPSGGLTFVNKRTGDYLGLPKDHPLRFGIDIGAQWDAHILLLHPADQEESRKAWSTCLRTGEARDASFRVRNAQGGYRWFRSCVEPLRASDGTLLQWVGVNLDIEELKCAEQALRESEYKLRQIIETVPGFLWSNDPDGELTHVNQRILDYTGKRLEDFKQRGWEKFQHPDDLPETAKAFYHAIQTGNSYQAVFRLRRADGEYRWYHARGEPLRDRDGRIVQWYGLSVDIDEGKKADERLRQLEADLAHMNRVSMMGELAASLSHEITQPIASARNNARAAQNFLDIQPPDLDEVREALSCVVGDTDHAGDIIDRIRDHIKNAPPRKDPFDLNKAINEVIAWARGTITANGVSVRTRLAEALPPVQGDRVQLQQVILNLILNAVEAMGSVEVGARELSISTEQSQTGGVLVAVRDTGQGIAPDHIGRVFEPFYTTKSSGVGIGLSICRSIVDAHGGRLCADVNVPCGAVFQFTVPGEEKELMNSLPAARQTREA